MRWGLVSNILWAWGLTLPAAAAIAALVYAVIKARLRALTRPLAAATVTRYQDRDRTRSSHRFQPFHPASSGGYAAPTD